MNKEKRREFKHVLGQTTPFRTSIEKERIKNRLRMWDILKEFTVHQHDGFDLSFDFDEFSSQTIDEMFKEEL